MGQQADICARARDYIATLSRTLRNDREDAGISFIESWMFSAALQILEATSDAPRTQALAAARGDLYVIARTQVAACCDEANISLIKWDTIFA